MAETESNPSPKPSNAGKVRSLLAQLRAHDGRRAAKVWHVVRWLTLRIAAVAGSLLILAILLVGGAGWYTSRPEFCRSCHVMEPYYHSWEQSSHSHVSCIECHFAPGFGGKLRGKMLGLVQLAKYVTASEGPRPAAEIPDASCLRSGCHETRLLSGKVDFHGIAFDHTPHLGDLRRGKKLRCTSCHSQIVQGKHMTVTLSTCFLCHFKEGVFNEGLGACTRCHQIPDKKFDLGGGVMFSHDLAYERGVDCANCHGDLIRGRGEVPRERCGVCHNRPEDLAKIDDHEFLHRTHVTDHKVDCLDCHLTIDHSLDRMKIEHAASDCASCHPDHHRDQVNMLRGMGGKSIPSQSNGMLSVRVECRTCHRFKKEGPTGSVLWKASIEVCTSCHEPSALPRFQAYQERLKAGLAEMEASATRASDALKSAKLGTDQSAGLAKRLETVQHDLAFLRTANGIHNVHYATSLTSAAVERLTAICRELKVPEPKVDLPPLTAPAKAAPAKKR
jgi:nitrate/TMAO reductase-like tetraheme cytochrome c subunit